MACVWDMLLLPMGCLPYNGVISLRWSYTGQIAMSEQQHRHYPPQRDEDARYRNQQGRYSQPPQQGNAQAPYPPQQQHRPQQQNQQAPYPQQRPVQQQQAYGQARQPHQHPPQQGVYQRPQPRYAPPPSSGASPFEQVGKLIGGFFKVLAYPFVKFAQLIGRIVTIILEEMVRTVVSFIMGIVMLVVLGALVVGYVVALIAVDFNPIAAVPEMFGMFGQLIGLG